MNYTALHLYAILFVVYATFKLLLASLDEKTTESWNHREGRIELDAAFLHLFLFFFNKRTNVSIIITLKKLTFDYISCTLIYLLLT